MSGLSDMAVINVLLEEGAERCTALAAFATAAVTAAGDVVEHAQALGLKAVDEAKRLHQEYSEAIEAIKHAAQEAGTASEAAADSVDTVISESTKAGNALTDMLVGVAGDVHHFGEGRARVFHTLDESARAAETGFHQLATSVQTFVDHVDQRINDAREALKHVDDAVMQVAMSMVDAAQQLHMRIVGSAQWASETLGLVTHALDQSLSAVAQRSVDYANDGIAGHNLVAQAAQQLYLEETQDDPVPEETYLSIAFGHVRSAMEAFQQLPEAAEATLQVPMPAILKAGGEAVTSLTDTVSSVHQASEMVTR
jgi:hypothetical protein